MKNGYRKCWVIITAMLLGIAIAGCHASYSGSINPKGSAASSEIK